MSKVIVAAALALGVAGCTYQDGTDTRPPPAPLAATGERGETLEEVLRGRTPGEPQECVQSRDLGGNRGFGDRAILFSGPNGSVVYLNQPDAACPPLHAGRALRVRTITTRLCRGDIVEVRERGTGTTVGACALGPFTPYRR